METIEDVLMATTVMEHSRFFCYMAKQIESHKGITNIRTVEKVMPQQISSNGFAGGCFLTYAVFGGISPLTCTIFDPIYFGTILRNQISHISPTSLKKFIMGNYLDFALKIAHRGNTGSHKGKRKLACLPENYICALLLFFSVFGLWHKANSAHFSGSYEKICSQIKKLTCNCSFSELTSHTTKEISSTSFPAFCRMYPSP